MRCKRPIDEDWSAGPRTADAVLAGASPVMKFKRKVEVSAGGTLLTDPPLADVI